MTVLISVVIPAYNAFLYLAQTVESVITQTHSDWEILIVDDGSTDETAAVAAPYAAADSRIRLIRQPNGGVSSARNRGLANTSIHSKYVAFLDADDVWDTEFLERLSVAIESDASAVGVYGLARYIDQSGQDLRSGDLERWGRTRFVVNMNGHCMRIAASHPTTFETLVCTNSIPASGVLLRKQAVEKVGGFSSRFSAVADWEMWLRLSLCGHFIHLEEVLMGYRMHGANMSASAAGMENEVRELLTTLVRNPCLSETQRRIVAASYRARRQIACTWRLRWAAEALRRGRLVHAAKHLRHAVLVSRTLLTVTSY